jgi:hypothetical protein
VTRFADSVECGVVIQRGENVRNIVKHLNKKEEEFVKELQVEPEGDSCKMLQVCCGCVSIVIRTSLGTIFLYISE